MLRHRNTRRRLHSGLALFASLGLWLVLAGYRQMPRTGNQAEASILLGADVEGAISQCKTILSILKQNDWDPSAVPFPMQVLPDGRRSPRAEMRDGKTSMFVFPRDHGKVAFYTDLYIDPKVSYSSGDVATTEPEGFYLVGYRNGEVRQVPLADARMAPVTGRPNTSELVLPGMKAYRKTLPTHPYLNLRKKE